ncbi:MAG: peptide chain release factor 2 [Verrucomicrobiota bacterium]|jgi:peptide chain release factor 2|nr:peptide chain release factor 2 [Verrucomicrobiota bacterium]
MRGGLDEMRGYLDIESRRAILAELEEAATKSDFWSDQSAAKDVIGKTNAQRAFVRPFDELVRLIDDGDLLLELAGAEAEGDTRQQALAELVHMFEKADVMFSKLRLQSLLGGKLDACNAFITLHSGAGGTESCDWADMLLRMYRMYCEDNGFEVEVLDTQPGEEAGLKSVTLLVTGPYAYGYFKAERGVHRLVRISPFDANKRRHTSFSSLDVVAELTDEVEVEIKDEDLRVDTYRSGGAGGQHVNKTDSAVRLTHLATGIVVAVQSERSQHKNKAKAMSMLKAKLYEYYEDKKRKEMERFYGEKGEIAWGSQIRSYVFQPYTMVKDHRTDEQTSNVQAVMDGHIQPFIEAYLKQHAVKA